MTTTSCRKWCSGCALCLASCLWAASVRAADTIETWAPGAADVEFYMGADGLKSAKGQRSLSGSAVIGYGLLPGLSTYFSASLAADGALAQGATEQTLGLFGTVVDSHVMDLDLLLTIQTGQGGPMVVTPGVEWNWDDHPDMLTWGLYTRLLVPAYGEHAEPGVHDTRTHTDLTINPGAYIRPAEAHQLLLELDLGWTQLGGAYRAFELGGVALGYNATLHSSLELISLVYMDVSNDLAPENWGLSIGFIATLE